MKIFFPHHDARRLVRLALREDMAKHDITTKLLIRRDQKAIGRIIFKEKAILCGIKIIKITFEEFRKRVKIRYLAKDGDLIMPNQKICLIEGELSSLLSCERVILNLLQRLSGIATLTRKFVEKVKGYDVKIMDTRKTTPALRSLEKYAVRIGGGENHRMDLSRMVLVKKNHLKGIDLEELKKKVNLLRKSSGGSIEIEAESPEEALKAAEFGDIIMLDNMKIDQVKKTIMLIKKLYGKKRLIELSGGVNLKNVRKLASTGADRISVGELTHSPKAIDISMEILWAK